MFDAEEPSSCQGIAVCNSSQNQPIKVTWYQCSSQCQRSYNFAYRSLFLFAVHSSSATTPLIRVCIKAILCKTAVSALRFRPFAQVQIVSENFRVTLLRCMLLYQARI